MTEYRWTTSVTPDARRVWRAARAPIVIAALIISGAAVVALFSAGRNNATLDPASTARQGSQALARLLEAQGVRTSAVRTVREAQDTIGSDSTLLVTAASLVPPERLAGMVAESGRAVLIAPEQTQVDAVLPGIQTEEEVAVRVRAADCVAPDVIAAGDAALGGGTYSGGGNVLCYSGSLVLHDRTAILGTGAPLTNGTLDENGNAALAMRLLGNQPRIVWFIPTPGDPDLTDSSKSLTDLIPSGWKFGAVQLAFAVVLLALWQARRLGRVVTEQLPVVVRTAETVEGRARMYRKSGAADHAGAILRGATIERLSTALGIDSNAEPAAVSEAVSQRSRRDEAEIAALLYGIPPSDDPELVRLADALDELERQVRTS